MFKKSYEVIAIRDYYPHKLDKSSSIFVHQQVLGVKKYNYETIVVSPNPFFSNGSTALYESYQGVDIIRPRFLKLPNQFLYGISFKSLKKAIMRSAYNLDSKIIHAHFGQNGAAAVDLKNKLNLPLVTSFYGYDSGRLAGRFKPYYEPLIRDGDLFLALSNDMKKDLIKIGFPKEKILIHHLGVDIDKFKDKKSKNKNFRFLVLAQFEENKGIHYAINAFSRVLEYKKNIRLVLVGSGPYKFEILKLINKLKISDSVEIIDNLSDPEPRLVVQKQMSLCDVFILPAITTENGHKQGTPVVLMEAQSCSKPCISTFHAGIPETVIDGQTGILVNERDTSSIADAMIKLLDDNALLKNMANNARKHIEINFNQEIQIEKLVKIYRRLID